MSAFAHGRTYRGRGGAPLLVNRRYFGGTLGTCEFVELAHTDDQLWLENGRAVALITRTARAAADAVVPPITDTLGGCFRPDLCDHYSIERRGQHLVRADAGPFAGQVCCSLCGAPPDASWPWPPPPSVPPTADEVCVAAETVREESP